MRIGELAKAVGLKASAIRYWEGIGVLPRAARDASGYRVYRERDVARLRLVLRARMLSLPLDETRALVEYSSDGRCSTLREQLAAALAERRRQTRARIRELRALEAELDRMCEELSAEPDAPKRRSVPTGEPCSCLDDPADGVTRPPRPGLRSEGTGRRGHQGR